ncbi:hypothetical protein BAUCODRAFT_126424 [Baudoinia panamericana UAMH 10762]|uniref:Uncharacterized protein n=1 Tax=Baudoinia panamericana (strain UAMH 10762) TaxID=717646 RepID=M2MM44_BAUPA|nr:uncharacterized protein BAUCODRAFT_126424 [Baudoinia panamericana UAMH 10762]EMC92443.1 hypothetical protein BAUCODRAFT_126424 [Baudoinia panamericana UAMH 10762]
MYAVHHGLIGPAASASHAFRLIAYIPAVDAYTERVPKGHSSHNGHSMRRVPAGSHVAVFDVHSHLVQA